MIYSVLAYLLSPLSQMLPEKFQPSTLIARLIGIPGSSLLMSIPLGWALVDSILPGLLIPGVDLIPEKASFLAYAFLYLCGWALWSRRDLLTRVNMLRIFFSGLAAVSSSSGVHLVLKTRRSPSEMWKPDFCRGNGDVASDLGIHRSLRGSHQEIWGPQLVVPTGSI